VPDQGPSRSGYPRSHYTHTPYAGVGHEGTYPRALVSSAPQSRPGITPGYDAPHASEQPLMGPRPPTEFIQIYSVPSAESPYPPGFVRQQSPRQLNLALPPSLSSAGAWNPWAGSSPHQSTSESHSPHNPGAFRVVCPQNPRPMARAPPSQSPTGIQHGWVPVSQVYLNWTFLRQPRPADNRTIMTAKKRKALVVCNGQTEYLTRMLISIGIEDWDQLPLASRSRL
jgi:hypothetical protein